MGRVPAGVFIEKAYVTVWSDIGTFNFYSGLSLEKRKVPNSIIEYFQQKNWDVFDQSEQLIFEDDTVWVCIY